MSRSQDYLLFDVRRKRLDLRDFPVQIFDRARVIGKRTVTIRGNIGMRRISDNITGEGLLKAGKNSKSDN